jgi:L-rhamnose mutarotase
VTHFVYAADMHDDPASIAAYEAWHRADKIWPSIVRAIRESGITDLELFRTGERLIMIIEAPDGSSPEARAAKDAANRDVQAWEALMST